MYSARYINAPDNLSQLFKADLVSNKCIKQIIAYIILCLALLTASIFGMNLFVVAIVIVVVLTIRVVITFSVAGNRAYQLSDTYTIADAIYVNIYACLRKLAKKRLVFK